MKTKRLSCERARSICIVNTLAKLGHFPSRKSEKEAWFLSPLRSETQASFKVSSTLNRWYDFGIGKGGNVVDLVCLISNCSVIEALAYLSDELPVSASTHSPALSKTRRIDSKNKILKVKPIEHRSLKRYLLSRNIPIEVARMYCKEIWFECNEKQYYALGLQNHLGGWELRNLYSKSSTAAKCYSLINNGHQHLTVLEGMFDLLTLATISPEEVKTADLVSLNSLSFIPEVLPLFKNYVAITLYLDRNFSGIKATADILADHPKCTDGSQLYVGFEDLNEKLSKLGIEDFLKESKLNNY